MWLSGRMFTLLCLARFGPGNSAWEGERIRKFQILEKHQTHVHRKAPMGYAHYSQEMSVGKQAQSVNTQEEEAAVTSVCTH